MFVTAGLMGAGAGLLGALLQGGLSAGLGLYGASQQADTADANRKEAARQFDANMAWNREVLDRYEQMSNTAHQREVQDLIAAGLNPILSATGGSGASSAMGPGGVSPTAHTSDLDMSSNLKMISDGINNAADQAMKASDLYSMSSLRSAQAAEALSNAAKNRDLTPAMKQDFIERANASAASANLNNTLADQSRAMTPVQLMKLRAETAKTQNEAAGLRIENSYRDRKLKQEIQTSAAMADYLNNRRWTDWVNAGSNAVRSFKYYSPLMPIEVNNYGDDSGFPVYHYDNGRFTRPSRPSRPSLPSRPIRMLPR